MDPRVAFLVDWALLVAISGIGVGAFGVVAKTMSSAR